MPAFRWSSVRSERDDVRLKLVCDLFSVLSRTHGDGRVPVSKAGKGSTDKSHTVKFRVRRRGVHRDEWDPELHSRTAIVPTSQLRLGADGRWTVPRWILEKKIDRELESLAESSAWPGLSSVVEQIQTAFDSAAASLAAGRAAELDRYQAEKKKLEDERRRVHAIAVEDGELALAFARRRLTLNDLCSLGPAVYAWPTWVPGATIDDDTAPDLARLAEAVRKHPDFASWREKNVLKKGSLVKPRTPRAVRPRVPDRVIEDCTVEWTMWVGSSRNLHAVNRRDEGCTVRVFGQKHEIGLPNGSVVNKMSGPHLKIIEAAPTEQVA